MSESHTLDLYTSLLDTSQVFLGVHMEDGCAPGDEIRLFVGNSATTAWSFGAYLDPEPVSVPISNIHTLLSSPMIYMHMVHIVVQNLERVHNNNGWMKLYSHIGVDAILKRLHMILSAFHDSEEDVRDLLATMT